MKKIVLFDMDGTLTPPRKPLDPLLLTPLKVIVRYADIGIVTGSDYDYVKNQLKHLMENSYIRYKLHLLPCNGTKHYTPPSYNHEEHKLKSEINFKENIGENNFNRIMKILIDYQNYICSHFEIPLTGHFISYRGSMINWSPIGRSASPKDREKFKNFDHGYPNGLFRKILLQQLVEEFDNIGLNITVKLGGETSFDIYPKGWDKTYSLKHFPEYKAWFLGDRCYEGGNDEEIYRLLLPNSYSVESTEQTRETLQKIIIPELSKGEPDER